MLQQVSRGLHPHTHTLSLSLSRAVLHVCPAMVVRLQTDPPSIPASVLTKQPRPSPPPATLLTHTHVACYSRVKIYAEDETGVSKMVCTYVTPFRAGRLLDTPRHAARFVSLLPMAEPGQLGAQMTEMWSSLHTFLSLRSGTLPAAGDKQSLASLQCCTLACVVDCVWGRCRLCRGPCHAAVLPAVGLLLGCLRRSRHLH